MADTQPQAPTDAELDELRQANSGRLNLVTLSEFRTIARAVLAKWGTLCAEKIVIPTDTMEQEFQKHYRLGYEAGKKATTPQPTQAQTVNQADRPFIVRLAEDFAEECVTAGYVTTKAASYGRLMNEALSAQAQAGAVPLDEARRLFDAGWKAAALFCDREDVVADGIIGFGACPQFEAAFSAAHGIKGGQHG